MEQTEAEARAELRRREYEEIILDCCMAILDAGGSLVPVLSRLQGLLTTSQTRGSNAESGEVA